MILNCSPLRFSFPQMFYPIVVMLMITADSYAQNYDWSVLPNSPVPDASQRFEDVYFSNESTGYIAQYSGKIYKTTNGGNSWILRNTSTDFPNGNYRSLGFFDSQNGLLGTLRFNSPLFRTTNGGVNWIQVGLPEPRPYGICGISVVNDSVAYAVGRYSAPANVIRTTNKGVNWISFSMDTSLVRTLVDCYFWSQDSGIVVGGYTPTSYQVGNAVVLITSDGGNTWQRVYRSNRTGEWCWKISFISREIGFVSIERHSGLSYILKTTDGGYNWQELEFGVYDQEGIGFVDENTGWVGGWTGPTFKTTNGGDDWFQVPWGFFINRYRFMNNFTLGYAVGDRVYKYTLTNTAQDNQSFAIIGDYGKDGNSATSVANYVKSWNPDFIITTGNNNFESGEARTIDINIGKNYSSYIHPYVGNYGTGDTANRFFPSMGEVDWLTANAQPYLDYFTLPGNERYYDFEKGNIHFFVLNSDPNEPDGVDSSSVQAQWLKQRLLQSTKDYRIVYFNHSPYTSGSTFGPAEYMKWPFKQWGASAVISGRERNYERLLISGIPYFVNGSGGKGLLPFGSPVNGSVVRYDSKFGYMMGYEFNDNLEFRFYNVNAGLIDVYRIYPEPKTLSLTFQIEGYVGSNPNPTFGENANVFLRRSTPPYDIVDSSKSLIFGQTVLFTFLEAANSEDYYIVFRQRNSLETWSSVPIRFTLNNAAYNFTDSLSRAYGNNLTLKQGLYCFYSGDINQDGVIDGADFSLLDNSAFLYTSGPVVEDLTGDLFVDALDVAIVDNNSFKFVGVIRP